MVRVHGMNAAESCPDCGTPLRPAVLEGLCPLCVANRSLRLDRVIAIADSPVADRLQPAEPRRAEARLAPHLRVGD